MSPRLAYLGLCASLLCCSPPSADRPDALPDVDAEIDHDAGADSATTASIRIATTNLRCLLDDWTTRVELLAAQIGAVDPDLLALQEVCRVPDEIDALPELLQRLALVTGRSYDFVRTETHLSWDQYQEGIAVVTPHEITDQQIIHLPEGAFPRSAVATRVQTAVGAILFASTHLSFGDDQSNVRVEQIDAALAGLEEMRASGEPVVLAGDFNESPGGAAIDGALTAGYLDSWAQVHPTESGETFPSSAPSTRIDYVLLSPGTSGVEPALAEVFLDEPEGAIFPSDHLGLRVGLIRE